MNPIAKKALSNLKEKLQTSDVAFNALAFFILIPGAKALTKVLLLVCLINALITIRKLTNSIKLLAPSILLVAYVGASKLWSIPPLSDESGKHLTWCLYILAFFASSLWHGYSSSSPLQTTGRALIAGLLVNCFITAIESPEALSSVRIGLSGVLHNPIHMGSVAVIALTLISFRLWQESWLIRLSALLMAVLVVLSGSRAAVAMGLIPALLVFLSAKKHIRLLIIASAGALALIMTGSPQMKEAKARGISYRDVIMTTSMEYGMHHPALGHGYSNCFSCSPVARAIEQKAGVTIRHPHSLLLSSLYYGGLIGLMLTAYWLLFSFYLALHYKSTESFIMPLLIVGLTLTGNNHIINALSSAALIIWLPMGLSLGMNARMQKCP